MGPEPVSGRSPSARLPRLLHPGDADRRYDAVIDASNGPNVPALALDLVDPVGRVVLVGVAGAPSLVDTRAAVLRDVTVVGLLAASLGLRAGDRSARRRRGAPGAARGPGRLASRTSPPCCARCCSPPSGAPKIQVVP